MHALEVPRHRTLAPGALLVTALLPVVAGTRLLRTAALPRETPDAPEDLVIYGFPGADSPAAAPLALAGNATKVATSVTPAALPKKDGGALTEEGSKLLPLVWLHIPKTGSSFATTLAHFGCPDIPQSVMVKEVSWKNPFNRSDLNVPFSKRYPPSIWCPHSFARFESGHAPVPAWTEYEHVVSMFRDPRRRLVSGYFHNYHDCPRLRSKFYCPGENLNCPHLFRTPFWRQQQRLREYHGCVSGCQAHMLAGNGCGVHGTPRFVNDKADKEKAIEAVKRLGFVGLTEEWPMSVCLFHAKFGGECYKASFKNVRPGKMKHRYDVFLDFVKWNMGIDDDLYSAAHKRFWQDIATHGVTPERCRTQICPAAAEFYKDGVKFDVEVDDEDDDPFF